MNIQVDTSEKCVKSLVVSVRRNTQVCQDRPENENQLSCRIKDKFTTLRLGLLYIYLTCFSISLWSNFLGMLTIYTLNGES